MASVLKHAGRRTYCIRRHTATYFHYITLSQNTHARYVASALTWFWSVAFVGDIGGLKRPNGKWTLERRFKYFHVRWRRDVERWIARLVNHNSKRYFKVFFVRFGIVLSIKRRVQQNLLHSNQNVSGFQSGLLFDFVEFRQTLRI